MLKLLGKLGMLLILLWGMDQAAGLAAFVDSISVLIVLGGGASYALAVSGAKQTTSTKLDNLGTGAVYFGWLGLLIGVGAIAQSLDKISDGGSLNVVRLGEAMSIGLLTVLYGYLVAWVIVPAIKSLVRDD